MNLFIQVDHIAYHSVSVITVQLLNADVLFQAYCTSLILHVLLNTVALQMKSNTRIALHLSNYYEITDKSSCINIKSI